ncbi:MAG: hypothetical protein ACYDCK_12400 [Thermoplasmatota archaeon]
MARPLVVAALVSLALLAPLALAGSEQAPELADPAGDTADPATGQNGDLLAVWIAEETATDFQVHFKLASSTTPGNALTFWGAAWKVPKGGFYAAIFLDQSGAPSYDVGRWSDTQGPIDFNVTKGTFTAGAPARGSVVVPKALFGKLAGPTKLAELQAATYDAKGDAPFFLLPVPSTPADPVVFTVGAAGFYTIDSGKAQKDYVLDANATTQPSTTMPSDRTNMTTPVPSSGPSSASPAASGEPLAKSDTPATAEGGAKTPGAPALAVLAILVGAAFFKRPHHKGHRPRSRR